MRTLVGVARTTIELLARRPGADAAVLRCVANRRSPSMFEPILAAGMAERHLDHDRVARLARLARFLGRPGGVKTMDDAMANDRSAWAAELTGEPAMPPDPPHFSAAAAVRGDAFRTMILGLANDCGG